jgi:low affinity Fe/Cu permease
VEERFARIAASCARWVGSPWSFALHLVVIVGAVALTPMLGLDRTMVVLTTFLTVTTELIAVLISNTQQRSEHAFQAKLDAILKHVAPPEDDALVGLEDKPAAEVQAVRQRLLDAAQENPHER